MKRFKLDSLGRTIATRILPDIRQEDWLALFLLALLVGAYVLLGVIARFLPGGIVENEETRIFVMGWILAPLCAVLAVPLLVWIRHKYLKDVPNALRSLLVVDSLLFALWTTGMNLAWQRSRSAALPISLAYAALPIVPLTNLAVIALLNKTRFTLRATSGWVLPSVGGLGFLNFIGFFPYFQGQYSTPIALLGISAVVGLVALIRRPGVLSLQNRYLLIGVDIVIVFLVILACFDPTFQILPDHESFYLGPVNRILHGGTMLVDSYSQYGVLVIYFLASIFKAGIVPFTYQGLSLFIAILFMLHFAMLYFVLKALLRDRAYALLVLILAILLGFFGTLGIIQTYPSTGPLRFGLAYLVLISVFLRHRFPRLGRAGLVIEYLLVSVALLWSFETFLYTVFPYLGICFLESFPEPVFSARSRQALLRRLMSLFVCLTLSSVLFALVTYARAAARPDWSVYFDFIKTYSVRGFGDLPIDPWSPWVFPVAVCFASLMAFVFRYSFLRNPDRSPGGVFIFGLTLMGIAQFTYYLGRSHPNNLYHISTPAVLICAFWFSKARDNQSLPATFRRGIRFGFFTSATLIILALFPSFMTKYQQDDTGYSIVKKTATWALTGRDPTALWAAERPILYRGSGDPQVQDALEMLSRFSPGQAYANVFLAPQTSTEILMRADRIQKLPINDLTEDSLSQELIRRILEYPRGSMRNEIVLVSQDPSSYQDIVNDTLQIQLIWHLCQEFTFHEVQDTPSGVLVIRLDPSNGSQSSYCNAMKPLYDKSLISQSELFR